MIIKHLHNCRVVKTVTENVSNVNKVMARSK